MKHAKRYVILVMLFFIIGCIYTVFDIEHPTEGVFDCNINVPANYGAGYMKKVHEGKYYYIDAKWYDTYQKKMCTAKLQCTKQQYNVIDPDTSKVYNVYYRLNFFDREKGKVDDINANNILFVNP